MRKSGSKSANKLLQANNNKNVQSMASYDTMMCNYIVPSTSTNIAKRDRNRESGPSWNAYDLRSIPVYLCCYNSIKQLFSLVGILVMIFINDG